MDWGYFSDQRTLSNTPSFEMGDGKVMPNAIGPAPPSTTDFNAVEAAPAADISPDEEAISGMDTLRAMSLAFSGSLLKGKDGFEDGIKAVDQMVAKKKAALKERDTKGLMAEVLRAAQAGTFVDQTTFGKYRYADPAMLQSLAQHAMTMAAAQAKLEEERNYDRQVKENELARKAAEGEQTGLLQQSMQDALTKGRPIPQSTTSVGFNVGETPIVSTPSVTGRVKLGLLDITPKEFGVAPSKAFTDALENVKDLYKSTEEYAGNRAGAVRGANLSVDASPIGREASANVAAGREEGKWIGQATPAALAARTQVTKNIAEQNGVALDTETAALLAKASLLSGRSIPTPALGMAANPEARRLYFTAAADAIKEMGGPEAYAEVVAEYRSGISALMNLEKIDRQLVTNTTVATLNADRLLNASGKFERFDMPIGNLIQTVIQGKFTGSPELRALMVDLYTFKDEYARVITRTTGAQTTPVEGMKQADKMFNEVFTVAELQAAIKEAKIDMMHALKGMEYGKSEAVRQLTPSGREGGVQPPPVLNTTTGLLDSTAAPATTLPAGAFQGRDGNWYVANPDGKTATRIR